MILAPLSSALMPVPPAADPLAYEDEADRRTVTARRPGAAVTLSCAAPSYAGNRETGDRRRRVMTRIPSHSVEDAPEASRALLREMIQFSPTGRPLNMHAQMAHAPAVLTAYVSIRRATARLGTLDQAIRAAL